MMLRLASVSSMSVTIWQQPEPADRFIKLEKAVSVCVRVRHYLTPGPGHTSSYCSSRNPCPSVSVPCPSPFGTRPGPDDKFMMYEKTVSARVRSVSVTISHQA